MPPLNLLLIDDSVASAALVARTLEDAGHEVRITRVDSLDGLLTELQTRWDIVVADYTLRSFSGPEALAVVREHDADVPFIFLSSTGEDVAVDAMRIGAQDYIMKQNVARLAPAVARELHAAALRREQVRETERVAYLAYHDELTDLPNRSLLNDRLHQGILTARREQRPLALLVLDLDGFKEINDSLGHHAGDRVLQMVAARLRAALRESDTVARLGGDEFAVLLPNTDAAGAELAAQKILQEIELPMVVEDRPHFIRASVGIALFPQHGTADQELLQKADIAMYVAKNDRSGFAVYSPDRDGRSEQRMALVAALWHGIEQGQFSVHYQPIIELRTGRIVALEALLRWDHPEYGRLSPRQFIQVAEQSGFITPLTVYAIRQALTDWPCEAHGLMVAVNLSPRSLHDPSLPARVRDLLDGFGLDGSCLALEITENIIMSDPERALRCLSALHAMGITLVMDDFGTGYSSLGYLRRLPVAQLKIDQTFVAALHDGEDEALVRSIIDLAHNMKLSVIAEGVESAAVCDRLRALNCDAAQGHYISAPAPAAEIAELIRAGTVSV